MTGDETPIIDLARARALHKKPTFYGPDWLEGAETDESGRTLPILRNVTIALRAAPQVAETFAYDEFNHLVTVRQTLPLAEGAQPRLVAPPPRALTDGDVTQIQEWLQWMGLPRIATVTVRQAIMLRSQERAFHPLRDYLNGLTWDGVKRLETFLPTYFGAEDTPYTRAIGRMFLISMTARAFCPGCQVDYVPVFEGDQGEYKSKGLRALASDAWFSDSLPDIRHKDASQHLRGLWLVEIAELSAIKGATAEALKAYITRRVEKYRPSHAAIEVIEPRTCVFTATTNEDTYLKDSSGNRRFWPVKVKRIKVDSIHADRDQIFAEAVAAYRGGESWWPSAGFERDHIQVEQEARFEADAWETEIERFIASRSRVQVSEVARDALGIVAAKIGTAEQRRITKVLGRLRWRSIRDSRGRAYVAPKA